MGLHAVEQAGAAATALNALHESRKRLVAQARIERLDRRESAIQKRRLDVRPPELAEITPDVIAGKLVEIAFDDKQQGGTKVRALELLGKAHGMFRDVTEERKPTGIAAIQDAFRKLSDTLGEEAARRYLLEQEGIDIDMILPLRPSDSQ